MGAEFNYRVFKAAEGKVKIAKRWAEAVDCSRYERGHSYSGDIGMLRGDVSKWYEPAFEGKDAERKASDFLAEQHEKWQPPIAVAYYVGEEKFWAIGGWCSS